MEDTVCNTKGPESNIITRDTSAHLHPQAAELSTQPKIEADQHNNGIAQSMKHPEVFSSRFGLHFLLVIELNYIEVTLMKVAMMQGIDETLALAFELDFQAANIL